jgi:hypothetical protein
MVTVFTGMRSRFRNVLKQQSHRFRWRNIQFFQHGISLFLSLSSRRTFSVAIMPPVNRMCNAV